MVQDFNEYINRLNRAADINPARNPVMDFINTHNRLQANPESMFGKSQIYNPQLRTEGLEKLYPTNIDNGEKIIQDAVKKSGKGITKAGVKTALKYAPLTGDVYDIYRGTTQAFNGHPYAGTAQTLLGAAGLLTLGGGSLIKSAGKGGAKWALKKGISKGAIKNTNKVLDKGAKVTSSAKYQLGSALIPEVIYMGDEDTPQDNVSNNQQKRTNDNNNINNGTGNTQPLGGYPTIEEIIAMGGQNQLPIGSDAKVLSNEDLDDIISTYGNANNMQPYNNMAEYQRQLLEKNRPYIEGLENYYKNYQTNLDEANRIKRYFTGLAGWSGNDKWAELANDYNPLNIEANKLALVKKLQEARTGNLDEINRIIGNIAIARDLGLPDEAALASKELLNARAAQQKNLLGYNARVYDTNVDNATRMAIKQGDWDTAFKLQEMKNAGGLNNAFASSAPFYSDPAAMAEIMKMLGVKPQYTPAPGLNQQGLPQVNQGDPYAGIK